MWFQHIGIYGICEYMISLSIYTYMCVCVCVYIYIYIPTDISILISNLVAQMVKNLPVIQETHVRSLGQEDPPEKEMATHSSILAWQMPWTEEPGGLQSTGSQRVRHD